MGAWNNVTTDTAVVRGVVHRPASQAVFELGQEPVGPELEAIGDHIWWVRWDRAGAEPHISQTIPFPSVHLTAETGEVGEVRHGHPMPALLTHGLITRAFSISLLGRGSAVGFRFRPGGWAEWSGQDAAAITDQVLSTPPTLATDAGLILAEETLGGRIALLRAAVVARARPASEGYLELAALVDRMREDSTLTRVEQLPALAGWTERTLQRRFRRMVGIGPKWVLMRSRMQEAAEALEQDPDADLAELAARFGWYDQAHFTNDFRTLLGVTPAAYARGSGTGAPSPGRA